MNEERIKKLEVNKEDVMLLKPVNSEFEEANIKLELQYILERIKSRLGE